MASRLEPGRIALIGCGRVGRIHAAQLVRARGVEELILVDHDRARLDSLREMLDAWRRPRISTLSSIDQLQPGVGILVIATDSRPRLKLLAEVVARRLSRQLILEKVLFPTVGEYPLAQAMDLSDLSCFVNMRRRYWQLYRQLRDLLSRESRSLEISVVGKDLGIGCNSIHWIDLLSFVANDNDITVDASGLEPSLHPAPRVPYDEYRGVLIAHSASGSRLVISSQATGTTGWVVRINGPRLHLTVDELNNRVSGELDRIELLNAPVCSNDERHPTGLAIRDLLNGHCDLAPFGWSCKTHLPLISALAAHRRKILGRHTDDANVT